MLCVYQSFTSLAGVYTDILFQSILKGTLGRAGDVNTEIGSSGTEHTVTVLRYPLVIDLKKEWSEETSGAYTVFFLI